MEEEIVEQRVEFRQSQEVRVKIVMQPKSLSLLVPLDWEINKIKCMLCNIIPKLEFRMISLTHQQIQIPGDLTMYQLLRRYEGQQSKYREEFIMNFSRIESESRQFEKYYSSKMLPLFMAMKMSPYQPLLHPQYYATHTQLIQTQQITSYNFKSNLRSLMNLRNLLVNRQNQQNNQNNRNNQNNQNDPGQNNEDNQGGLGLLGGRPNGGGNGFERGAFWFFKIIQAFILWNLVQFIINNISKSHIFIITLIVVAYLAIDYFQRRRNNQPRRQERELQADQEQRQADNEAQGNRQRQEKRQAEDDQNSRQKVEGHIEQVQARSNWKAICRILLPLVRFSVIVLQSGVSFVMSLFPNWNVQLHLNMFQNQFLKIDNFIHNLQGKEDQPKVQKDSSGQENQQDNQQHQGHQELEEEKQKMESQKQKVQ